MRINPINNNLNFQRAIEIKENGKPFRTKHALGEKNTPMGQIVNIMRNLPVSRYDSETRDKIREFLKNQIKDYDPNKNNLVVPKLIGQHYYIFTGKDAKRALELKDETNTELDLLKNEYANNSSQSEEFEQKRREIYKKFNSNLFELIENGKNGKPLTILNLITQKRTIREIEYQHTPFQSNEKQEVKYRL